MKKGICLFLIFGVALMLSACRSEESFVKEEDNQIHKELVLPNYNIYQSYSDEDLFNLAIYENPIDMDFEREIAVSEMNAVDIQKKYLDIWIEELNFSVAMLGEKLSPEDFQGFLVIQEDWERMTASSLTFEKDLITNRNYGQYAFSGLSSLLISARREAYRERAIRVKYLTYLLDFASSTEVTVRFTYESAL